MKIICGKDIIVEKEELDKNKYMKQLLKDKFTKIFFKKG